MKAIETVYDGYKFRSRLEARWAVFFNALNIKYDYEIQGYALDGAGYYLPDFWLPQVSMWAEAKAGSFTMAEASKCEALAKQSGYACLMLEGPPAYRNYWAFECGYGFEREPEQDDYVLYEGHRYWETEGRFFGSTGAAPFEVLDLTQWFADSIGETAVLKARQARFEHGESP